MTIRPGAERERFLLLRKLEDGLELPMLILSFAWLVLMILEFTRGLSPFLEDVSSVIWGLFVLDYFAKLALAQNRWKYVRTNWITAFALLVPAIRVLRVARVARLFRYSGTLRGLRLARVLTSLNRGITALGRSLGRRGFGYVLALTCLVALAGAAGMFAFEKDSGQLTDYGTALWWTAMVLTTMGSDYFPKSPEGKLLCLFLAVYGFAVFGYVTAGLATFFVSREAADKGSEMASQATLEEIQRELTALRRELRELRDQKRSA